MAQPFSLSPPRRVAWRDPASQSLLGFLAPARHTHSQVLHPNGILQDLNPTFCPSHLAHRLHSSTCSVPIPPSQLARLSASGREALRAFAHIPQSSIPRITSHSVHIIVSTSHELHTFHRSVRTSRKLYIDRFAALRRNPRNSELHVYCKQNPPPGVRTSRCLTSNWAKFQKEIVIAHATERLSDGSVISTRREPETDQRQQRTVNAK